MSSRKSSQPNNNLASYDAKTAHTGDDELVVKRDSQVCIRRTKLNTFNHDDDRRTARYMV